MINDEELQKKAEAGNAGETRDELAYRYVFSALRRAGGGEPIHSGLADRVIARLEAQRRSKRSVFEWLIAAFGGLCFLTGLVVTIAMTEFRPDFGFLTALAGYKGLFLFGIVFVIIINILDRQLLRKKRFI